jgi:hypothetical protein
MWIKGHTGNGMATFWKENKINSRINVACFYFRSLVCQILTIWGMDHVGTWFCKRCVWNFWLIGFNLEVVKIVPRMAWR